jgi:hypothetical protein
MPAAALAVHQLRYWLAYGPRANAELADQGHSYLHSLVPWAILGIAVGTGLFLRRLVRAARNRAEVRAAGLPIGGLWLVTWASLVAIYATQETLEEFLATGHPAGIAGVFGHGGWWAVPAAAVVAIAVVCLLVLARTLLRLVTAAACRVLRERVVLLVPCGVAMVSPRPLASSAAGRAPPAGQLIR